MNKPIVFIDIETTGLDPAIHEILEICLLHENGEVLLEAKIKPEHIETAHPRALEVNHYSEEAWADAKPFSEVASQVQGYLSGVLIGGQNPAFDMSFVKQALTNALGPAGLKGVGYHLIDIVPLSHVLLVPKGLTSLSLGPTCDFLGIEIDKQHSARGDVEATRKAYLELVQELEDLRGDQQRWREQQDEYRLYYEENRDQFPGADSFEEMEVSLAAWARCYLTMERGLSQFHVQRGEHRRRAERALGVQVGDGAVDALAERYEEARRLLEEAVGKEGLDSEWVAQAKLVLGQA